MIMIQGCIYFLLKIKIEVLNFYLNTFRNVIYYFRGINLKIWSYFLIRRTKNCKVFFGEINLFDWAYQTFFVFEQLKNVGCTYRSRALKSRGSKVTTFSSKVTVNKLEFWCNKKISIAALNPSAALNLERLLSGMYIFLGTENTF